LGEKPIMTKEIALTFDDGPWGPTTASAINELIHRQVPATFMLLGEHIELYPQMLRRAAESQLFAFGNHTFHHQSLKGKSQTYIKEELRLTSMSAKRVAGVELDFVRPPFGSLDFSALNNINLPVVLWSLDTMSWEHHSVVKNIERIQLAKDGDIVLMHDFQKSETEALPKMLDILMAKGFTFKTVPDLIGAMKKETVYYSRDERKGWANTWQK
jgi:peptidoglycan/xylan/chitin deacetylase (PgdA/CDA1 family)